MKRVLDGIFSGIGFAIFLLAGGLLWIALNLTSQGNPWEGEDFEGRGA